MLALREKRLIVLIESKPHDATENAQTENFSGESKMRFDAYSELLLAVRERHVSWQVSGALPKGGEKIDA